MKTNFANIMTGDILVYSGTGIFSKLIKWFTKSEYSHVGIAVVINGRVFNIEAMPEGVRMILLSKETEGLVKIIHTNRPLNLNALFSHLGDDYDFAGLFILALERFGIRIRKHNDKWFCSELVSEVYNIRDAEFNAPSDIVKYFSNNKKHL